MGTKTVVVSRSTKYKKKAFNFEISGIKILKDFFQELPTMKHSFPSTIPKTKNNQNKGY